MPAAPVEKLSSAGTRPIGLQREEGDGKADRVGQQHADRLPPRGERREAAAEREAAGHEAGVGDRLTLDILDDRAASAVDGARLEQRREQRAAIVRRLEDQIGHDVVELHADRLASNAAAQRRIDRDAARLENGDGDAWEKLQPELAAQA